MTFLSTQCRSLQTHIKLPGHIALCSNQSIFQSSSTYIMSMYTLYSSATDNASMHKRADLMADLAHVDAHSLAAALLKVSALFDLHTAVPGLLLPLKFHFCLLHFQWPNKPCKELLCDGRIQLSCPLQQNAKERLFSQETLPTSRGQTRHAKVFCVMAAFSSAVHCNKMRQKSVSAEDCWRLTTVNSRCTCCAAKSKT